MGVFCNFKATVNLFSCVKKESYFYMKIIIALSHIRKIASFQMYSFCLTIILKDTHRKKSLSNKTQSLLKSMNMDIWVVGTSNQLFIRDFETEIFSLDKLKQLLAKPRSLRQVHFALPILFVLTLASGRAVLYGNIAFSILVLSTKKRYSNFLKKVFIFDKILLTKLKY